MSQNSQKRATKANPKSTDWFFIQNEHDGTCAIGDPSERMPVARAASAEVATRICKAVNDHTDLLAFATYTRNALSGSLTPEQHRDLRERAIAVLAKAGAA